MNPRFDLDADGIGRITFHDPVRAQNVLTEDVLGDLELAINRAYEAVANARLRALLVTSAIPGSFIAGADVGAITAVAAAGDRDRGAAISREVQVLFGRIADMPVPTIAAIQGVCLGGGTEIALACAYRVSDDDNRTRIGLPEVQLGILPGWGGTTRLPRLVGLRAALDLLLTGKPARVSKARRIGLVDKVFPRHQFRERCLDFAREVAGRERDMRAARRRVRRGAAGWLLDRTAPGRWLVLRMAAARVRKLTGGNYPAPPRILDVVRRGLRGGLSAGLDAEAEAIGDLIASPACRNLLFLFGRREAARKGPWSDGGRDAGVKRMAVIGAGQLGAGIAQLAAYNDLPVRMKDVRHEAVAGGLAYARSVFDGAVKRRRMRRRVAARKMGLMSGGVDYSGVALASVVVEAVVERMDVKQAVLREVEDVVAPEAVIVTNTSSLSVDEMASALKQPGRFAGMHFFHPVHRMPLVEVVAGEKTDADAIETVAGLAARLGKVPVITRDAPGFLVNRIIGPGLNEAGHLLQEGWDAVALDRVWTRFGMPMGPCRLIDTIGMEVAFHAGQALAAAFGDRLTPAPPLEALSRSGRPGQKGGRGFYLYEGGKPKGIDPSVYADMGLSSPRSGQDPVEARDRTILAMVNEAARVLEDGVVGSAADVDLGMIMGAGFPPFRGGLLTYADDRGLDEIAATLTSLRDAHGDRFQPTALLLRLAEAGETFHGAFPPGGAGAASVAGIVLAAGGSSRMGTPKALLDAGGMTFVARLVETLACGGCDPVVVVASAAAGGVADEVARSGARLVVNPGGEGGQIGSLRAGLAYLTGRADPPAAVAFTPVDNPAIAAATVRALIAAWRASRAAHTARASDASHAAIVLPRCGERRGHPVLADMAIAHEFHERGLPEGARTVVRRDPDRVIEVEVGDPGTVDDIDTPERYRERFPSASS